MRTVSIAGKICYSRGHGGASRCPTRRISITGDVITLRIAEHSRIIVLGNNGSGKSYLTRELSAITGMPLVHLDVEFWGPDWQAPSKEAWRKKNEALIAEDAWIIDGLCNHGGTVELRFAAADLVIFLDISRLVCLMGVIRRNGTRRTDTTQYLYERFDGRFLSLCRGIWTFPWTRGRAIMALHERYPGTPFLRIRGRRRMKRLLASWRDECAGRPGAQPSA